MSSENLKYRKAFGLFVSANVENAILRYKKLTQKVQPMRWIFDWVLRPQAADPLAPILQQKRVQKSKSEREHDLMDFLSTIYVPYKISSKLAEF